MGEGEASEKGGGGSEEEFAAESGKVQDAVRYLLAQKEIAVWRIEKIIGAGANGVVARVTHLKTGQVCVMKVALSPTSFQSLVWESEVMGRIRAAGGESRTEHLVRRLGGGMTKGPDGDLLPYVVMENLPGNPVSIIGCCVGEELVSKVCYYGLQLLKAIYDMHRTSFVHRDIKPENLGLFQNETLVLYDLGMARALTDRNGQLRPPRSNIGMRGTDEWASLHAEQGRDQGPVDDLWGWFYVMVEWMNCTSKSPLAWAAFDDRPAIRHLLKSSLFSARVVLRGCPKEFFQIQAYLRCLGRCDFPDYYYLASLLKQAQTHADQLQESSKSAIGKGNGVSPEEAMQKIVEKLEREEVLFLGVTSGF